MTMVVAAMMLLILKFKIWRPMHPMIVGQVKPQKIFLGNVFLQYDFECINFLSKPNDEKCMKQNHGSDWSGDDWDDGSGSGLSDCKYCIRMTTLSNLEFI